MRIRVAGVEDDPERLFDLLWMLAPDDDRPDPARLSAAWNAAVTQAGRAVFLAEAGPDLVGTLDTIVVPNLTRGARPFMLIENVVVRTEYRRRGIASALLEAALARAAEQGCYKVQLLTNSKRADAHLFYEKHGFARSARGYRHYL
ncbi:GNAT superfamily N-acetyltransferase [Actinokineospora baliensis]|uniref:GNAT family N-acetyltransferase n=1 Tax=Actinokineospora baliensis TaxID=547056 RepID=UPI0019574838|nr:GNAT family N-acetyltransferase [Actinokineospora baliensis]MBM7774056.1 GNAT superfamily N-acetyltransferase [Actinokineospora baliensis]